MGNDYKMVLHQGAGDQYFLDQVAIWRCEKYVYIWKVTSSGRAEI